MLKQTVSTVKRHLAAWSDEAGTTTLEWAMLLAVIALPSYYIIRIALETLLGHYRMMTTLNALPFP